MAAVFLAVLAAARLGELVRAAGSDYTVTAQYQLEEPQKELVNVNTAGREELESLSGIGPALAQRIIDHREANGPFLYPEDWTRVKGIGEGTLSGILDQITTGG